MERKKLKDEYKLPTSMVHCDKGKSLQQAWTFVSKGGKAKSWHPPSACDPERYVLT